MLAISMEGFGSEGWTNSLGPDIAFHLQHPFLWSHPTPPPPFPKQAPIAEAEKGVKSFLLN